MRYLTPGKAATMLGVSTTSLHSWETEGLISPVRTPGGHRRYRAEDIERLRDNQAPPKEMLGMCYLLSPVMFADAPPEVISDFVAAKLRQQLEQAKETSPEKYANLGTINIRLIVGERVTGLELEPPKQIKVAAHINELRVPVWHDSEKTHIEVSDENGVRFDYVPETEATDNAIQQARFVRPGENS